jgi:LTXXQ motif family protein
MSRPIRSVAIVASFALVALPALAGAQYVRHENDPFGGKPAPIAPVSVAKAILERADKDKDLALDDRQKTQLQRIQARLDSANAPYWKRLDAVRPTWRPAGGLGDLSQDQRDQLIAYRQAQEAIVDSVAPNVVHANEEARALLRPEQRDRVAKYEKDARKRAEEMAKKEFEVKQEMVPRERRRGEIRDGTGRPPLD